MLRKSNLVHVSYLHFPVGAPREHPRPLFAQRLGPPGDLPGLVPTDPFLNLDRVSLKGTDGTQGSRVSSSQTSFLSLRSLRMNRRSLTRSNPRGSPIPNPRSHKRGSAKMRRNLNLTPVPRNRGRTNEDLPVLTDPPGPTKGSAGAQKAQARDQRRPPGPHWPTRSHQGTSRGSQRARARGREGRRTGRARSNEPHQLGLFCLAPSGGHRCCNRQCTRSTTVHVTTAGPFH